MAKRSRQPKGPHDRRDRPLERLREFEAQRGFDPGLGPAPDPQRRTPGDQGEGDDLGNHPDGEVDPANGEAGG
jgi:hypothetical protein